MIDFTGIKRQGLATTCPDTSGDEHRLTQMKDIRPLVLNDIHTCRKLVVREGTRIDVSVK